jgi:hypothetical protein
VELTGRRQHEGLFSIGDQPFDDGTPALFKTRLRGPVDNVTFSLISEAGGVIGQIAMEPYEETESIPFDYLGSFQLPQQRFRVRAAGNDGQGKAFTIDSRLFSPERFRVVVPATRIILPPGANQALELSLENAGPEADFEFRCTGTFVGVAPTQIRIASGERRVLVIELTVPENVTVPSIEDITATIALLSDSTHSNSNTLRVVVTPASYLSDDGVAP